MKVNVELPVAIGEQIWFMIGVKVVYGVLCGFQYFDGKELHLHIFLDEDKPILTLDRSQCFATRQELLDYMFKTLLDNEVELDI